MECSNSQKRLSNLSRQTLLRLPEYLNYLKLKRDEGQLNISSPLIASEMHLHEEQVRKDLASVSTVSGKPKMGYNLEKLICDIESLLGYDNITDAVLVGVGHLGKALLSHEGFGEYGVNIIAGFDIKNEIVGKVINKTKIFGLNKFEDLVSRLNVHIGIIAVSADSAQSICDEMIKSGISAIWNFAPVHLRHPKCVIVKNENLAISLAVLSKSLEENQQHNYTNSPLKT